MWDGPSSLVKTPFVKSEYPAQEDLFVKRLGLATAGAKTAADEAKRVSIRDPLPYLHGLLFELKQWVTKSGSDRQQIQSLRGCLIFPIWTSPVEPYIFSRLGAANAISEGNDWYIADKPYLRDAFSGVVPLLALDGPGIDEAGPLIECMDCSSRKLSALATKKLLVGEKKVLDETYTEFLRRRWKLFARYAL